MDSGGRFVGVNSASQCGCVSGFSKSSFPRCGVQTMEPRKDALLGFGKRGSV